MIVALRVSSDTKYSPARSEIGTTPLINNALMRAGASFEEMRIK